MRIGSTSTDILIFDNGIAALIISIPFGGNSITEDIREGCSVSRHDAERLKVQFGSALANKQKDNEAVFIEGDEGRSDKDVSIKDLALIIQARAEELI